MRGVAERRIECDGLLRETAHNDRTYDVTLTQLDSGHLVLAARLETFVNVAQTSAPPEAEQDALLLCANQDAAGIDFFIGMTTSGRLVGSSE
jgi:hypothetical protein